MYVGSDRRWREGKGQQPAALGLQPSSSSAPICPQRLPCVGPGRRGHLSAPRRKPPGQPDAAGRHPLHALFLPALTQPDKPQLSDVLRQPRANQRGQHPEGDLILHHDRERPWWLSNQVSGPQHTQDTRRYDFGVFDVAGKSSLSRCDV